MGNAITAICARTGGTPPVVVDSRERIRESYGDYLSDESRFGPADADRLVVATDEGQVVEELARAAASGSEVTVSAGRTGIVGGAVPRRGTLLSLAEMKRALGVRRLPDGRFAVRVEPGLTVVDLRDGLERGSLEFAPAGSGTEAESDASGTGSATGAAGSDVEAFLADESGWFYPPDPTEETAHVGATVATNASGARSYHYGATRSHVHAVRMCLTTGGVIAVERGQCVAEGRTFVVREIDGSERSVSVPTYQMPRTKSAAGYYASPGMDLVDLIVGSEGTLGVITEVELVLARRPEGILSALAFFDSDESAVAFVRHARGDLADREVPSGVAPISLEFFDSKSFDFLRERKTDQGASSEIPELPDGAAAGVLFEQSYTTEESLFESYEGWEEVLRAHGSSMEDTWGGMEDGELTRLRALRHAIPEEVNSAVARAKADHPEIHKIGTDAAVPREALEQMFTFYRSKLDDTSLRHVIFGHIGDSHLHLNIMPRDPGELAAGKELAKEFAKLAVELGGTVSAEHGIGRIKHDLLRIQYGDGGLKEMAAVKLAFDPSGILNRGVMFPESLL